MVVNLEFKNKYPIKRHRTNLLSSELSLLNFITARLGLAYTKCNQLMLPHKLGIGVGFVPSPSILDLMNVQSGFPGQPSIQPVSRGWIGLDAEARRGDTPIRQVIQSVPEK